MFRIFIVLIIIIGASSGVLFTNAYLSFQQSKTNLIERDRIIMRDIKNQLVQSIVKNESTGLLMLPYGQNIDNSHILPSWLYLPRTNPFGQNYIYCPFGETSTSTYAGNVSVSELEQYGVSLYSGSETGGNEYVLFSEPFMADNILGVIISNHNSENAINCNELEYENNLFYGMNSLVEVIYKDSILYNDLIKESYFNIQEDQDMLNTMSVVSNRINDRTILNLENDINTQSFNFNNQYEKRTLIINGNNNNLNAIENTNLEFNNMNVYINNVNINNNINFNLNNSNIYFKNSVIGSLSAENTKIKLVDTAINSNNGWLLNNSKLNIEVVDTLNERPLSFINSEFDLLNSQVNINNSDIKMSAIKGTGYSGDLTLFNLYGSKITINNSIVRFEGNNAENFIWGDLNSSINKYNTTINSLGTVNRVIFGNSDISNYVVNYNNGANVISGSMGSNISLNRVNIDSPSGIGILDEGITTLSGLENTITAGTCIMGELSENVGRLIEKEFDYSAVREGSYVVDGGIVNLNDTVDQLNIEIDVSRLFKDIDINCI